MRCDGCGQRGDLNVHGVTNRRDVRYCDSCDALRETYGIRREQHEQYCLRELADQIARQSETEGNSDT